MVVSQVVPYPHDSSIPLISEFKQAMLKYQHDAPLSFTSLEGYIVGRLFCAIATEVDGELTREAFLQTMERVGRFNLGGLELSYGPDDHQGMDTIYLTTIYPEVQRVENE